MSKNTDSVVTEDELALRLIEAYLTAFRREKRHAVASQMLLGLKRMGWVPSQGQDSKER